MATIVLNINIRWDALSSDGAKVVSFITQGECINRPKRQAVK
jgi:hypothetical protein